MQEDTADVVLRVHSGVVHAPTIIVRSVEAEVSRLESGPSHVVEDIVLNQNARVLTGD